MFLFSTIDAVVGGPMGSVGERMGSAGGPMGSLRMHR